MSNQRKKKNPTLAILVIVIIAALIWWFHGKANELSIIEQIPTLVKTFPTGDEISFYLPTAKPLINSISKPLGEQMETNITPQNKSNSTQTGTVSAFTATKTSPMLEAQNVGSGIPQIHLGNVVSISGQIQIVDPTTMNSNVKRIIDPPYDYVLEIVCTNNDCQTPPSSHGRTNTIGQFEYKWTPNPTFGAKAGSYVAKVYVRSQALNPLGVPYQLEADYPFILVE